MAFDRASTETYVDPAVAEGEPSSIDWRFARISRRFVVPVGLLALWQSVAMVGWLPETSLPSPTAVIDAWWTWIFGPKILFAWYSGTWLPHVLQSLSRVAIGFVIAASSGVVLGILIGWYAIVEDLFDGTINFLRAVPMTAWVPFTVFFFGIHEAAAIFLIAFGSFFPIVVNVASGTRQTPRTLIRAALMLGTRPSKLLLRVALPSALPSVFAGLRIGLGLAWVLVIVAEMLAVQGGIGYALWSAYQYSRLDLIVCAIASVGMLGLASDWLLIIAARHVLRWQRGLTGQ